MRIIAFLALFIAFAPTASAVECPPHKGNITVNFTTKFPQQPVFYEGYPRAEVQRRSSTSLLAGQTLDGLTVGSYTYGMRVSVRMAQAAGGYCVYLDTVDLTFEFKDLTVFVVKELARGTCRYNVALTHEMEHVDLFRKSFNLHAPLMRNEVEGRARSFPVLFTRDRESAASLAQKELARTIHARFNAFQDEARRQNATIDTPENYRALSLKCRGKD